MTKPIHEKSKIKPLFSNLSQWQSIALKTRIENMNARGYTYTKIYRAAEVYTDILLRSDNIENANAMMDLYTKTGSHLEKMKIRYGDEAAIAYSQKLRKRPKPSVPHSVWQKEFWIARGYKEEDAIKEVAARQSRNALKRGVYSYKNHRRKLKWCMEYWIVSGYSEEDAKKLAYENITLINSPESYIEKYGEKYGEKYALELFKDRNKRAYDSRMRTGILGGYVSKESQKFFLPLYKKVRKLGVPRDRIYMGVRGSKEFFIREEGRENKGYMYDFAIPSINIIVEYHGIFWHPREDLEWKNPFITKEKAERKDLTKRLLCDRRGYEYIKVWSDEKVDEALNRVFEKIRIAHDKNSNG